MSSARSSHRTPNAYRVSSSVTSRNSISRHTWKFKSTGRAASRGFYRPYGGRATCRSYTIHGNPRWNLSVPCAILYSNYSSSHFRWSGRTRRRSHTSYHNHLGGYRYSSRYRNHFRRNHRYNTPSCLNRRSGIIAAVYSCYHLGRKSFSDAARHTHRSHHGNGPSRFGSRSQSVKYLNRHLYGLVLGVHPVRLRSWTQFGSSLWRSNRLRHYRHYSSHPRTRCGS